MAFGSCYFMGTACRGGTVDACFVHNVTYIYACLIYPVFCISHFVWL